MCLGKQEIKLRNMYKIVFGVFDIPKSEAEKMSIQISRKFMPFQPEDQKTYSFEDAVSELQKHQPHFRAEMLDKWLSDENQTKTFLVGDLEGFRIYKVS